MYWAVSLNDWPEVDILLHYPDPPSGVKGSSPQLLGVLLEDGLQLSMLFKLPHPGHTSSKA